MASLNEILVIGYLTKDPTMRYTPAGKAVTQFAVATNRKYTGANGQPVEEPTFHNVECWGKLAEIVNQFAAKGRLVFVQGRQEHQKYEDPQTKAVKYFSRIVAGTVLFLDRASERTAAVEGEPASEDSLEFNVPETGF